MSLPIPSHTVTSKDKQHSSDHWYSNHEVPHADSHVLEVPPLHNVLNGEKPSATATTTQVAASQYLEAPPLYRPSRPLSPDALSNLSAEEYDQLRPRSRSPSPYRTTYVSSDEHVEKPYGRPRYRERLIAIWHRNLGLLYMLIAMLFGTLMNVTTRMLEVEGNKGKGLHPFQVRIVY